jgi:hypothetical protein
VTLRWTDPGSGQSAEVARDVNRSDIASNFASADSRFKLDSLVAATAEFLRHSPWIPGYSMRDLQTAAGMLTTQLPNTDQARDFVTLIQEIRTWD